MTEPQQPRSEALGHPAPDELSLYAYGAQEAAPGVHEHVEECASCAAELADLRLVLSTLADLPEPELPVEVGIRLDAALERAWQEADAEQEAAAAAPTAAGARRRSWRKFAMPVGAFGLLVVAGVGVGLAVNEQTSGGGSASGSSAAAPAQGSDSALTSWVHSVLPASPDKANNSSAGPGAHSQGTEEVPKASANSVHSACPGYPERAGYRIVTTAQREFDGWPATLIVYQNDQGPASSTVFAVVYAGPCPTASSTVLDQGLVSR